MTKKTNKSGLNKLPYRSYLVTVIAVPALLLALLLVAIQLYEPELPAPAFSQNESFNEKVRWIRHHAGSGCDLLIAGSSIALYNVNGPILGRSLSNSSVLNLGAWGTSVDESAKLVQMVAPLCKPKIIVFATYYGDFDNQWKFSIDWDLVQQYLGGGNTTLAYLRTFDAIYYAKKIGARLVRSQPSEKTFTLNFDETGSVMIACAGLEFDAARWFGYQKVGSLNPTRVVQSLEALRTMEAVAQRSNAWFLVIHTPMTKEANEKFAVATDMVQLWDSASRSLTLGTSRFLDPGAQHAYGDELFVDFAHMNKCGAEILSEEIKTAAIDLGAVFH